MKNYVKCMMYDGSKKKNILKIFVLYIIYSVIFFLNFIIDFVILDY